MSGNFPVSRRQDPSSSGRGGQNGAEDVCELQRQGRSLRIQVTGGLGHLHPACLKVLECRGRTSEVRSMSGAGGPAAARGADDQLGGVAEVLLMGVTLS